MLANIGRTQIERSSRRVLAAISICWQWPFTTLKPLGCTRRRPTCGSLHEKLFAGTLQNVPFLGNPVKHSSRETDGER